MADEKLELTIHESGFLLRQTDASGVISQIILTRYSLEILAQSSPMLLRTVLVKPNSEDVSVDVHMPVVQVSLNTDLHQCEILIGMIDGSGAIERFSLPLEVAKPLAERLPIRVAEIEAAIPTQTKQ